MAEIIMRILGPRGADFLYTGLVDENMKQLPTLESLKYKIFIRVRFLANFENCILYVILKIVVQSKSTKIKVSKFSCKKAPEKVNIIKLDQK